MFANKLNKGDSIEMQLILFGIIAVIGVIVYLCYNFFNNKKSKAVCPSCGFVGGGSVTGGNLSRITAERMIYSYSGKDYEITFYFKCKNCGKEKAITESHYYIDFDIDEEIIKNCIGYSSK